MPAIKPPSPPPIMMTSYFILHLDLPQKQSSVPRRLAQPQWQVPGVAGGRHNAEKAL
jgi:hypothetical protein